MPISQRVFQSQNACRVGGAFLLGKHKVRSRNNIADPIIAKSARETDWESAYFCSSLDCGGGEGFGIISPRDIEYPFLPRKT